MILSPFVIQFDLVAQNGLLLPFVARRIVHQANPRVNSGGGA
jgi:hypothetical protein